MKANPPLVYLCGPINGCTDSECNDWRSYAKEHLVGATLDPMRRDYRGRETLPGIAAEIVAGDEADVRACDVVLANCPKPSWGTAMELRMAKAELGKVVVVVLPSGTIPSPWLIHHSDVILHSIREAILRAAAYPNRRSDRGHLRALHGGQRADPERARL